MLSPHFLGEAFFSLSGPEVTCRYSSEADTCHLFTCLLYPCLSLSVPASVLKMEDKSVLNTSFLWPLQIIQMETFILDQSQAIINNKSILSNPWVILLVILMSLLIYWIIFPIDIKRVSNLQKFDSLKMTHLLRINFLSLLYSCRIVVTAS